VTTFWHGLGQCDDPENVRVIETAEMLGDTLQSFRRNQPPESGEYVYASPSKEVALAFSALSGGRAVCEVDPGELVVEVDPDFPILGVRFKGPVKVVSTEVVARSALPNARQIVETLSDDYVWGDGTPYYSRDGFMLAPPAGREWGYADKDFEWLGPWFPLNFLILGADGIAVAFNEHGRAHQMYPPDHPDLDGRRRVPLGSLGDAWNEPGEFPDTGDLLTMVQIRLKWNDETLEPLRVPWEW